MNPARDIPNLVAVSAAYETPRRPSGARGEAARRNDLEPGPKLHVHLRRPRSDCALLVRMTLLGAVTLGCTLAAGCSTRPLPNTPAGVDAAYGIPSGSVPADLRRPDGMLKNGLLPAQSNG
jgi:hypothetical protein